MLSVQLRHVCNLLFPIGFHTDSETKEFSEIFDGEILILNSQKILLQACFFS